MLRLIIETSNLDFQLGLHSSGDGGEGGSGFVFRSDQHDGSAELTAMLADGLSKAGKDIADIGEIVVDLGPGGLTSTRSGIAFANGLAFARDIKIVGVNSMDLMVLQAGCEPQDHVIAARRSNDGNYFMGFFSNGTCHRLALGKPLELINEQGWQGKTLTWIGPYPKTWADQPPELDVNFNALLSPGLDAFDILLATDAFGQLPRVDAAGPMNETIR